MPMYRVAAGKHHHDDGHTYVKGEVFEDAREDLDDKFKNKFEKINSTTYQVTKKTPDKPAEEDKPKPVEVEEEESDDTPDDDDPRGKEVTSKFEVAEANDWQVFKNDDGYTAYDHSRQLNDKPYKSKAKFTAFLAKQDK